MKKKNILICLEKLGVGGIETAVLNQASTFLKLGHKVVILAKSGLYTSKLQNKGAICEEFEFELLDNLNLDKIQEIVQIIQKYEIDEIHIHQFPCLLSAFTACLITNKPYIAYAHNGIGGVYEWFMNTFPIYKLLFPYYYQNAYKIITTTDAVKQDIVDRFNISKDKILVSHNSISFEEVDNIRIPKENTLCKFLLVSRFSKEKGNSIFNGIDLYYEYLKINENATLEIIGDGELKSEIEDYVKEKELGQKVVFLGSINNVLEKLNDADIVLGLGRCILEAVAMQKIAIIIGYEDLKPMVTPENIKKASDNNFSGRKLESQSIDVLIKQLQELTNEKITEIVQQNYDFAKSQLNIENNIYTIDGEIENTNQPVLLEMLIKMQNEINDQNCIIQQLEQEKDIMNKENIEKQKILEDKQDEVNSLENELTKIYKSKRWRYIDKIANLFH